MKSNKWVLVIFYFVIVSIFWSCNNTVTIPKYDSSKVPQNFLSNSSKNPNDSALKTWRSFFSDTLLIQLIDTALNNNLELKIIQQRIEIDKNEILAKKGEYLPF